MQARSPGPHLRSAVLRPARCADGSAGGLLRVVMASSPHGAPPMGRRRSLPSIAKLAAAGGPAPTRGRILMNP